MKRTILVVVFGAAAFLASAQEQLDENGFRPGVQLDSDGVVSIVARLGFLEAAIKAQGILYDTSAEDAAMPSRLLLGAHVVYLFGDATASRRLGTGIDVRTALGTDDVEYDEYIDAALRLTVDQFLGNRLYVTGILFPFWVETRDVSEVESDWQLAATIPRAAIAVTLLF